MYAMDLIATKLVARTKIITEFSGCFPVAHVIMMTCIHTPGLVDVIIAHLNKVRRLRFPLGSFYSAFWDRNVSTRSPTIRKRNRSRVSMIINSLLDLKGISIPKAGRIFKSILIV